MVVGKPSSIASGGQNTKAAAKDNKQQMTQKFPHLNITQMSTSPSASPSGSSPKPLLSVKPSSQLLKPGAMTNMSSSAAAAAGNSKHGANTSKMTPADAKNKLAMFKAQVHMWISIHLTSHHHSQYFVSDEETAEHPRKQDQAESGVQSSLGRSEGSPGSQGLGITLCVTTSLSVLSF